jgi:hypothetical protein
MIHLGAQAELHRNGAHLLLRTYFAEGSYAYIVQNLHGGMPVALCDERFKTSQEAMRKAEEVASRALGIDHVAVSWTPTKAVVSSKEPSRLVSLPLRRRDDIGRS